MNEEIQENLPSPPSEPAPDFTPVVELAEKVDALVQAIEEENQKELPPPEKIKIGEEEMTSDQVLAEMLMTMQVPEDQTQQLDLLNDIKTELQFLNESFTQYAVVDQEVQAHVKLASDSVILYAVVLPAILIVYLLNKMLKAFI